MYYALSMQVTIAGCRKIWSLKASSQSLSGCFFSIFRTM